MTKINTISSNNGSVELSLSVPCERLGDLYVLILIVLSLLLVYGQAGPGQSVWLEEMADWGGGVQNRAAVLPLLVRNL